MIDIIITSYKEPNSTIRAVKAFLAQADGIKEEFRITVVDPFPEVEEVLEREIKDKRVVFFLDPGEGKSYALNILFQEYASKDTNDLFISTDGDVYVNAGSVAAIRRVFSDSKVGCVTGKPVPLDERGTKYGYWAHLVFGGIDKVRARKSAAKEFFECSGYLFAIRKGVILDFPMETSEDSIIPYLFWKKGYRVAYVPQAEVYVKNPTTWNDWLGQKVRNVKAHENLNKIAPDMPRTKSFWNEVKEGTWFALTYPRSIREFFWTVQLFYARLHLYFKAHKELRKKKTYNDGWRGEVKTDTTKTLD